SVIRLKEHFRNNEPDAVESLITVQGFSFGGRGQNNAMAFIKLKPSEERESDELSIDAITGRAMTALSQIKDAMVFAFGPPAVPELGTSAGFVLYLKDNANLGLDELVGAPNQFLGAAAENPTMVNVRHNGQSD